MVNHESNDIINVTDIDAEILNIRDTLSVGLIYNIPKPNLENKLQKKCTKIKRKFNKPVLENHSTTKILNRNIHLTNDHDDHYVDVVSVDESVIDEQEGHNDRTVNIENNGNVSHHKRELCEACEKSIYTHNTVVICYTCSKTIHYKCLKKTLFKISEGNGKWYCNNCQVLDGPIRYNPYKTILPNSKQYSDHFYDQEPEDGIDIIHDMYNILNNCASSNISELNSVMHKINENITPFSIFFNNIDGNASNFDEFQVEIERYQHPFSVNY